MRWSLAALAAVLLCASAPPGWFPGAGWLVVPGWMAFYALLDPAGGRARLWQAYLVGVVHVLAFSFSVRHLLVWAYIGIGLVGGLYYLLTALWTRALGRWLPGGIAFGIAVAGACWLRANFTEIQYPHAQPIHGLYHWPAALGCLRWGGEIAGNLVLACLAGSSVDLYRSWRLGRPGFAASRAVVAGTAVLWLGSALWPRAAAEPAAEPVRISLLEPRLRPENLWSERRREWIVERALEPTIAMLETRAIAPDLVVWPESVYVHAAVDPGPIGSGIDPARFEIRWLPAAQGLRLPSGTRLLAGADLFADHEGDLRFERAVALLTDATGRYLGHHEKQRRVPGGEHTPFFSWLPETWSTAFRAAFEETFGRPLQEVPLGEPRPLLETADGVTFGACLCFENAYPAVIADLVTRGARFVVVLSNECWYRGGAELDQMVAMSVCRAVECGVPLVRCTVDGATVAVDASGRQLAALPWPAEHAAGAAFLHLDLALSPHAIAALPSLTALVELLVLASSLSLLTLFPRPWGRLDRLPLVGPPEPPVERRRAESGP